MRVNSTVTFSVHVNYLGERNDRVAAGVQNNGAPSSSDTVLHEWLTFVVLLQDQKPRRA